MDANAESMLAAWREGKVCVHPTDTVPGLSCDPMNEKALTRLKTWKGRGENRPFIGLVPHLDAALKAWKPLPAGWEARLEALWPRSVSVIWQASSRVMPPMVADDGSVALRCPAWPSAYLWMKEVLGELNQPMPSTSVNKTGEAPLMAYEAIVKVLGSEPGFYLPALNDVTLGAPSSLIKIEADGRGRLLREGALSRDALQNLLGVDLC